MSPITKIIADKEGLRLEALRAVNILDTPNEPDFDILTRLAMRKLNGRACSLNFVDSHRHWAKSSCGLPQGDVPIEHSFCAKAVEADEMLIIEDASKDPRFYNNPMVVGEPHIRFYAGVPVRVKIRNDDYDSVAVGILCTIDNVAHAITEEELADLKDLARLAEVLIEVRYAHIQEQRMRKLNEKTIRLLNREQRQFKQAERMANIGSWRMTYTNNEIEWSDQVFAIHELPHGDIPSLERAIEFYPENDRRIVQKAIAHTIETGESFEFETDFMTAENRKRRVRSIGEVEMMNGKPVALIGVFQDITAQYHLDQALRKAAMTDDLTQLPNRGECNRVLDIKIQRALENDQDFALIMLDLDGFKKVNDLCGHHKGDELLKSIAAKLRAPYLSDCFAARLGGDEFVIAVSSPRDCAALDALVSRLLGDLREKVTYKDGEIQVSGTLGICWLDKTVEGRSDLMKRADKALYAAKNAQRGTAQVFPGSAPSHS